MMLRPKARDCHDDTDTREQHYGRAGGRTGVKRTFRTHGRILARRGQRLGLLRPDREAASDRVFGAVLADDGVVVLG